MKLTTRHPDLGTMLPLFLAPETGEPPAGGPAPSPEDRLAVLERDHSKLQGAIAERDQKIALLEAESKATKEREAKRREAEVTAYVGGLKAKAAEKGVAIDGPKLAQVEKLFAAGMDDAAKTLGDALLANALGPKTEGSVIDLAGAADPQIESDKVIADNLRASGWTVEQDAKGRITGKTPPKKAGR